MLESLHIKKLKIKIKLLKLHEKIFKMIMIKSLILVNINLKYIHRSNLNSQIFIWALTYLVHFRNLLQVNLCQKLLFLHQLTHNMTTDCSLNYKFNTWKFQAQTWGEHDVYRNCFWHSEQFLYTTCSPHVLQKEELLTKIYLYKGVRSHLWAESFKGVVFYDH